MRIIAGQAKGHRLQCLDSKNTRPTSDRVREAIFSSLSWNVPQARVLDLFAGTGAMGLEALSRGAQQATFVEQNLQAFQLLQENAAHCKMLGQTTFFRQDVTTFLREGPREGSFDLIFLDPPYFESDYLALILLLAQRDWLSAEGILVVEASKKLGLLSKIETLRLFKEKHYGNTLIGYYHHQK